MDERDSDYNFFQLRHEIGAEYVKKLEECCIQFHMHMHRFYEIIFVLDGSVTVSIENNDYEVQAGDMILIKPNMIHGIQTKNYSKSITCIFSSEMIMAITDSLIKYRFFSPIVHESPAYCRELLEKMDENANIGIIKGVLYSICGLFYKQLDFTLEDRDVRDVYLLRRILDYVEKHIDRKISIRELADEFNYSATYLSRYFNKIVGTSFSDYVSKVRISRACYLLRNENGSVAQISDKCGYESSSSFNRNFRQIVGCSPTEYREKNK